MWMIEKVEVIRSLDGQKCEEFTSGIIYAHEERRISIKTISV